MKTDTQALQQLDEIQNGFAEDMQEEVEKMFAAKLGLPQFDEALFGELATLMMKTSVDYTIFFRELSSLPSDINPLKKSFYSNLNEEMEKRWIEWLKKWKTLACSTSEKMKSINPKYSLREWLLAPAYQQAALGNYTPLRELQSVMTHPYEEQSEDIEEKYYRLKPSEFGMLGGLSHMSCSS